MKTMTEMAMVKTNGGFYVYECNRCTWWNYSSLIKPCPAQQILYAIGSYVCPNCGSKKWTLKWIR